MNAQPDTNLPPDVFAIYTDAMTCRQSVVILKSKAIQHFINVDGMTDEEAEEMWTYNIAGSLGQYQYSTVDDMVDIEIISELVDNGDVFDPRNPEAYENIPDIDDVHDN